MSARSYAWTGAAGLVLSEIPAEPLMVADSWLVDGGRVRALEHHQRRFAASCAEAARLGPGMLDAFWAAVCGALPRRGRWFPGLS